MQRRLIIPFGAHSDAWARHLTKISFSANDAASILEGAVSAGKWLEAGVSKHMLHWVTETHRKTWFSVDGLSRAFRSPFVALLLGLLMLT